MDEVSERRKAERVERAIPVRMITSDGKEHVAMTVNVSDQGALCGTPHQFALGEMVRVGGPAEKTTVTARVIRFERNHAAETILWRYRVALAFDGVRPRFTS